MGRKFTNQEFDIHNLLIQEIMNSKELFKSLLTIVNTQDKEEINRSINSLDELSIHVRTIKTEQVIELLERYEAGKKLIK